MATASTARALCLILLTLGLCQAATAARTLADDPTPVERVQQAFTEVTALSINLRIATQQITIFNAAQQGFIIAQGFTNIVSKVALYITFIPSPDDSAANVGTFGDDDAKLIVQSLTTFVQVHQALLNVVIGKHGLLTLVPFFEPIRISLVSLEAVIDEFAFKLIALIPTQKPEATKQFDSLSVTLTLAIDTYKTPVLASGSPVSTDPLATEIVEDIKQVTALSDQLREAVKDINLFNAVQKGPLIAQGFGGIIATVAQATEELLRSKTSLQSTTKTLGDDDAKLVVDTLTTFVKVHQALLNVVIGKHGILTLVPFFEPIRVALVQLEAVVDTFAFTLIGFIPTQESPATTQVKSLDETIALAIKTYESPLFKSAVPAFFANQ